MPTKPPTSQKGSVRPIAFVLQNGGSFGAAISLRIRPEDLTITYPSRSTVHQTMGRDVGGWVDHFGQGLPNATISGHTGWRAPESGGEDGLEAFMTLRKLINEDFPNAKQAAIEAGADPATVKLLYVDLLDEIGWNVNPGQFILRRSKSRPLLLQYNVPMQAISTTIDTPSASAPFTGTVAGGLGALTGAVAKISSYTGTIQGLVDRATGYINGITAPIGAMVKGFLSTANGVFQTVQGVVSGVKNGFNSVVNGAIGIASDVAKVGVNVMRTFAAITGLPSALKASLMQVAAAFNEVKCIFSNALKPQKVYEDYDGLYGASNCSSTTGGRGVSAYTGSGPFAAIQPERGVFSSDSSSLSSVAALTRSDAVLAPMPMADVGRHLGAINSGLVTI